MIAILAVVFVTFSVGAFSRALEWLRLGASVWQRGFVWELVTYPWVATGSWPRPSLWILFELLVLYWFAQPVLQAIGRRRFWRLFVGASAGAAVVAALLDLAMALLGFDLASDFRLMQGQRMLILIAVAAFATVHSRATILLFFVLPIQARWFLWLELAIAFIGFLGNKDIVGFVGVAAALYLSVLLVRSSRGSGGLRELRLRIEEWWIRRRLGRMRRRSRLRLVESPGSSEKDEYIH